MGHRPAWRAPFKPGNASARFSALFLAKRAKTAPTCQGIARSTGKPCQGLALRGAKRCRYHGGLLEAAKAEAERFGRPVVILRNPRKASLGKLGSGPWPDGLVRRADLMGLGPVARGRLFEAYANRELDPDTYKHELRQRPKRS